MAISHLCFFGPSGETRTRGILVPNQAPYQLGHTRKSKVEVLSKAVPYSRLTSALSICKQNQGSATATKQLGHTRISNMYYIIALQKKQPENGEKRICIFLYSII